MKEQAIPEAVKEIVGRHVEHDRRVAEISRLKEALLPDLLNAFNDRFPYFRFESERSLSPTEG